MEASPGIGDFSSRKRLPGPLAGSPPDPTIPGTVIPGVSDPDSGSSSSAINGQLGYRLMPASRRGGAGGGVFAAAAGRPEDDPEKTGEPDRPGPEMMMAHEELERLPRPRLAGESRIEELLTD